MKHVKNLMKQDFVSVDHQEPISQWLGGLEEDQEPVAVITHNGGYHGMLDVRQLLVSRLDTSEAKLSKLSEHVAKLKPKDELTRAAELLSQTPHRALPVLDGEDLVGVLYQADLQEYFGLTEPRVKNVLQAEQTLGDVIHALRTSNEHAVIIKQSGAEIGVVTTASVLVNYYKHQYGGDEGMRPGQKSKARRGENSSVLDLPLENFIEEINEFTGTYLVSNQALRSVAVEEEPRRLSFAGFDDLNKFESADAQELIKQQYDKLSVHAPFELKVHLKTYNADGSKKKVSVVAHAQTEDGTRLEASADEWSLVDALRGVMEKLEWQLRKHSEKN